MSVLRAFLTLGRVSLLPTVWSNCLAGWWLGGGGSESKLPFLLGGATCVYLGGAFLNDAFDALFDRQHRRTRPIPAGTVTLGTVWLYGFVWLLSGIALLFSIGLITGCLGLLLAFWALFFDAIHRALTFSPLVLGVSRLLLYLVAASIGIYGITGSVIWCGLVQAVYVGAAGFSLRRQNPTNPVRRWPLLLLASPIVLAVVMNTNEFRGPGLLLSAVLGLWILRCARHSLWSLTPEAEVTASGLLAGIVLVDWLAVPDAPRELSLVFIGLFLLTWFVQSMGHRAAAT